MERRLGILGTILAVLTGAGCDGDQKPAAAEPSKAAKEDDEAAKAAAARKAKREEETKREEEAKAEKEAALDALVVLPPELPKKQDKACKAMLAAYDGYMRSILTGDLKTKWETGGNEMQLKIFEAECRKRPIEVAACQAHALGKMGPEHEKDMSEIFTRCVKKFGGA